MTSLLTSTTDEVRELARDAYEGGRKENDPPWEKLNPIRQLHWISAASSVSLDRGSPTPRSESDAPVKEGTRSGETSPPEPKT